MQQFTAIEYIKIDIANHYGLDKATWKTRLTWVNNNTAILECYDIDANSPILYSKAVRALREAQADKPIGHMVSLDATWSGGQLMAVLMRCAKTAEASNLINMGTRVDIYTTVQEWMNNTFNMITTRQDIKDCLMP